MNTNSTPAKLAASVVRHGLTTAGGAGLVAAQDDLLQLVSLIITAIGLGWSIWEKLRRPGNVPARNRGTPVAGVIAFCILTSAFCLPLTSGCSLLSGQRALDPAGVYQGDPILWQADGLIVEIDEVYDQVLALAERNPAVVANSAPIQNLVDRIHKERDGAPEPDEILTNLIKARDAYAARSLPEDATALQSQLSIARVALDQAREILPALLPPANGP